MARTGKIVDAKNLKQTNNLIKLGKIRVALPLVGTKQKFSAGQMGKIQKDIFEKENITPKTFRVQEIPRISGRGGLRTTITPINKFKLGEIVSTSNRDKYQLNLSFLLQRGSYATIFLREIIKPSNPINAGF